MVQDLFPRRYETKLVSHQDDYTNSGEYFHVRVALKTKEEFVEWLKLHQNLTGITYRVLKTTRCEGKRSVYKVSWMGGEVLFIACRKCNSFNMCFCIHYLGIYTVND